ncbi:hypothetical protein ACS0TY_028618 [Phlomoides rotata]
MEGKKKKKIQNGYFTEVIFRKLLPKGDPLYDSLKILFRPDGNESDEEPDDIPVVIDAQQNPKKAGPTANTMSNLHR